VPAGASFMLFPTIAFAVFFLIVLPVSWTLMPRRVWWRLAMVAASWVFYGFAGWGFVPLLAASTIVNHAFAHFINQAEGSRRRWLARVAVAVNLSGLGWFKYIGFLSASASSLLDYLGLGVHVPLPKALLPAGISFFTFQALSYVIDVNRRKLRPVSLLDFAVYLSFFPHLLSGPIVRASEFLPQIRRAIDPRRVDLGRGLWLVGQGLFKKVVIASYLGTVAVDPLFGFPHQHGGVEALFGIYAYAVQIYADFSGYTDMAIGLALLLGVRFPQNFDAPYKSRSLQEFWRRWHMTLSRWLRDYLYIPLGGNRRGNGRTYVNLFLTMVLGGLWHGAAWTFVAWGALHGAGLAAGRVRTAIRTRRMLSEVSEPPPLAAAGAGSSGRKVQGAYLAPPAPGEPKPPFSTGPTASAADSAAVSSLFSSPGLAASALPGPGDPLPAARSLPLALRAGSRQAAAARLRPPRAQVEVEPSPGLLGVTKPIERVGPARIQPLPVAWRDASRRVGDRFRRWSAVTPAAGAVRSGLAVLFTFNFVCLGWVFFRATSFGNAVAVLGRLFASGSVPVDPVVVLVVVVSLASQFLPSEWSGRLMTAFSRARLLTQAAAMGLLVVVVDVWGPAGVPPFIYFRF
jgi:alginate O-acetyltransferase complex protein AlgI